MQKQSRQLFLISFFIFFMYLPPVLYALDTTQYPETDQTTRNQVALSKLQSESDAVAVYVRGFCCPSCGIGVRLKVSRLDFVDLTRFNKGVDFDVKHQLVTVAIKRNEQVNAEVLAQAITNAGYDPVHLYRLVNNSLETEQLETSE